MWRKERAKEWGGGGGGEKREFYARSTILAGESHMPTPLMPLRNSGRIGGWPKPGVVRDRMRRGIIVEFC